jgi:sugar phosphate isomerase/epimerase
MAKMHERISVHSICFPTAGIEELGRNWRAVDATRVSFSSLQVLDYGTPRVRRMLDAAGQQTETVTHVFRAGPLASRAADMEAERTQLTRAIEAAALLGARSVYMLTGGRGEMNWEQAAAVFAATIAPCRKIAQDAGIALAIENTSPFYAHSHLSNNLRDTITLAEIAEIGVCIDVFGCWTEAGLREQILRAMPRCELVQVSDYVLGDRALPCRAVPGDGVIPWPDILRWLLEAGYTGTFDLELIGPRIDQEGQVAAVRRSGDVVGAMLADLGLPPAAGA